MVFCFICFLIGFSFLFFSSWYRSDETPASLLLIWLKKKKNWLNLMLKYDYFLGFFSWILLACLMFVLLYLSNRCQLFYRKQSQPPLSMLIPSLEGGSGPGIPLTQPSWRRQQRILMSQELQPYMLREALYNAAMRGSFLQVILVSYCLKSWPFHRMQPHICICIYVYMYIYTCFGINCLA